MLKPERLAAFSDGVIAIAITLLVLGLEVPSVHQVPEQELTHYLRDSFHAVSGYVSSFILVGTYWLQHYVIFHYVTRVDRTLVVLNGLFLLVISFVPFPTGLQSAYRDDELAMVLYGATQAVCGISLLAIWTYATSRRRLVQSGTSDEAVRSMWLRLAMTPVISLAAIALSVISIDLARLAFGAIPIIYFSQRIADGPWNSSSDDSGAEE